ncbi:hypothetical protein BDZ45DRAFT_736173 [Acephala macrosclerotiorum]|nr:hypothetical protein BDZ45DRAFT_736173 [Acephala macrosclerotiorum]
MSNWLIISSADVDDDEHTGDSPISDIEDRHTMIEGASLSPISASGSNAKNNCFQAMVKKSRYMMTATAQKSLKTRNLWSVNRISKRFGATGPLYTIIRANGCGLKVFERDFRRKVEGAALNLLDQKKFLVCVKGNIKLLQQETMRSMNPKEDKCGWIVRSKAFCIIGKSSGLEWLDHEEGLVVMANMETL